VADGRTDGRMEGQNSYINTAVLTRNKKRVCACLPPSFRWYTTHEGTARLSWPGFYVPYGLPKRRRLTTPVLTGLDVEQLR